MSENPELPDPMSAEELSCRVAFLEQVVDRLLRAMYTEASPNMAAHIQDIDDQWTRALEKWLPDNAIQADSGREGGE